jgi:two-component system, cell cycle response regulator
MSSTTLRVLIVDDSPTVRGAVVVALTGDAGPADQVELHEAGDGEEAVLKAHMVQPHVILMDVQMPGMSGIEALAVLQSDESTRDVPVVMLTQLDEPGDIAAALQAGAYDYLRKPFDPVELLARVRAAGRTGALVAQLRQLNSELDHAARTDQLTGLANRRAVDEAMRDGASRPLAVALIDIDHFKAVNDTYGHDVGDEVLRIVADRLRMALRDADVVGRWGGEEFLALLPGADPAGIHVVCDRVLAAIREPLGMPDGPTSITVSIGIAASATGRLGVDELLRSADAALYEAKDAGRDRMVVAE